MLHKVLCETEIALLSEEEKRLYQKQQKEYSEREAFVNRLEQLDSVEMPNVKPKKFAVKVVKPAEFNSVSISEKKIISQPEQLKRSLSAVKMKHCMPVHIDKYELTSLPHVFVNKGKGINWEKKNYVARRTVIPEVVQPQISCELEENAKIEALPEVHFDSPKKIAFFLSAPVSVSVANSKTVAEAKKIKFSYEPYQIARTNVLKTQAPKIGYELPETALEAPRYKDIDVPKVKKLVSENNELNISVPHGKVADVPQIKAGICNAKVEKTKKVYYQCPEVKCEELSHTTILPDILVVSPDAREISQEPIVITKTKCKKIIPASVNYEGINNQITYTEKPNVQVPGDSKLKCRDTLDKILISLKR